MLQRVLPFSFLAVVAALLLAPAANAAAREPITPPLAKAAADARTPAGEDPDTTQPLQIAPPSKAAGATVARIVAPSFARARLDTPHRGRPVGTATAWSQQSQILLVLDAATRNGVDWVKVLLAQRPDGSTGWIPRDNVTLGFTPYWIDVGLRSRTVTVFRNGRGTLRTRAVVGRPATPTPRGLAAIYERNRQPDPRAFLGPWALALTSLSNVLESYGGGPGRVAIHGRAGASFADPIGSARSHGCIRIDNRPVTWMATHIPAGTPVEVTNT
ncbi:MAG TPA: L,D-transpeptidase [Conexibacter sp.]|jgi:lipoprotein-anchoring transpeptidase ErfK/SrfK